MKLIRENVDKIFSECEWPVNEWMGLDLSLEESPDAVFLLHPLPFGMNIATFHPEQLKQHKKEIGKLLDQVLYLSSETDISFPMLGYTVDQRIWAEDPYEIQKLYLLGAATNQLVFHPENGRVSIEGKENQEVITAMKAESDGNKVIAKRLFMESSR